ncbi:PLDc N-terminal domain-containing protein [Paeniglutamicibacter kerguelensis]|uniref:Na+-translocating ferredoxin:NAD+ oxidoreductase RnfE subunit n=1 Tax=Paeniglutamicibacter kerguelensis TaxID=254788 RepID=A0ABS4XCX3_9MICC|nr:PLDc N-terminal domain-containing protein [Paeniglutamicibacter kerguelensis]MBP2386330.1 Na+-translocating ferredoxin:NAD+ oxidoreductase RnfE subunit [Paeniglutamicibacter kerguelensis]
MAFLTMLISVIADLFRDRALNGWLKAVWLICLVFVPIISILVYLIARGDGMAARNPRQAIARQDAQSAYIRSVAGVSLSDEIGKARGLLDAGTITAEEYTLIKERALSG